MNNQSSPNVQYLYLSLLWRCEGEHCLVSAPSGQLQVRLLPVLCPDEGSVEWPANGRRQRRRPGEDEAPASAAPTHSRHNHIDKYISQWIARQTGYKITCNFPSVNYIHCCWDRHRHTGWVKWNWDDEELWLLYTPVNNEWRIKRWIYCILISICHVQSSSRTTLYSAIKIK